MKQMLKPAKHSETMQQEENKTINRNKHGIKFHCETKAFNVAEQHKTYYVTEEKLDKYTIYVQYICSVFKI